MADLSGFEVLVLAKEVDRALRGAYVNNIYTIGSSQLLRFRRPGGEDLWLVVSPRKGAWISSRAAEREETTKFTSELRGELERARLSRVAQYDLDRVLLIDFEGAEGRTLVVELMPPGNLIVLDPERKIRLVKNEVRSDARRIVKGAQYLPPKQSRLSPSDVDAAAVSHMLDEEDTLGGAIGKHVALPRKYVADALGRLGADDATPSDSMKGKEEAIARTLVEMVESAKSDPRPCVCQVGGRDEIFAYRPVGLEVKVEAGTISELCDRLFVEEALSPVEREGPGEARRRELQATASKLREESKSLLARASKAREGARVAQGSALQLGLELMRDSGAKPTRAPTSSEGAASALYDLAKELEARSSVDLQTAADLEKKANRVPAKRVRQTKPIGRKRGDWYEKFRWFLTSEGRLAIGGRDAQSNSMVLGRHLDPSDTVYHADLFGSPFFVLKGGSGQSDEEAKEVAQATVSFSSAWKTGLGSADAYWVNPDQVSAAAPSGEYLARGSYAIRGKKNFIPKMMVELALGVDSEGRVTAGPEAAIRRSCDHYLVLRPHNEKASDTAKRIFRDLAGHGEFVATLDDIQRTLPAGGGKVVRRV